MNNKLIFNNITLTDSDIWGGVKYNKNVNPDTDLTPGTVAAAKIEFITDKLTYENIGDEFDYYAKQNDEEWNPVINSDKIGHFNIVDVQRDLDERYKITAYDDIIKLDAIADDFVEEHKSETYSWTQIGGVTQITSNDIIFRVGVPAGQVELYSDKLIIMEDNVAWPDKGFESSVHKTYFDYSAERPHKWIINLWDNTYTQAETIARRCHGHTIYFQHGYPYERQSWAFQIPANAEFTITRGTGNEAEIKFSGPFTCVKLNNSVRTLTSTESTTYPINTWQGWTYYEYLGQSHDIDTIADFLTAACGYLNIPYTSSSFTNSDFIFNKNIVCNNVSFRQLFSYIAQIAAGFIHCDNYGQLKVSNYSTSGYSIYTNSIYKQLTYSDFTTPAIDRVWAGKEEGDIGVSYPTEEGTYNAVYRIEFNPFLFLSDEYSEDVQEAVYNIYEELHDITYIPMTIDLSFRNDMNLYTLGMSAGKRNGETAMDSPIFNISWDASGMTLSSTGNAEREKETITDPTIAGLAGRYNIIRRDLNQTISEIGTMEGDLSSISQRVDAIETKVVNVTNSYRQDYAPSNPSSGDLWFCTLTSDTTHYGKWWRYNGSTWQECNDPRIDTFDSRITQNANSIALVVEGSAGSEVIKAGQIALAINQSTGATKAVIDADHIDLTGVTTFLKPSDVGPSGTTVIDGGRINTVTLTANSITTDKLSVAGQDIGSSAGAAANIFTTNIQTEDEYVGGTLTLHTRNTSGNYTIYLNGYSIEVNKDGSVVNSIHWTDLGTAKFG